MSEQQAPIPWPRTNAELLAALKEYKRRRAAPPATSDGEGNRDHR